MSAPDNFLSRWSRRKLEAEKPEKAELDPETPVTPLAVDQPTAESPPAIIEPVGEGALSEEEIAALPRLEDLTPATDLVPFMRNGVPALLRNAALRRMWSLDPAIRDFAGEARDYSYDWNVPGGVPVSGPLLPGDDAEATLSRMFSRLSSDGPSDEDAVASEDLEAKAESQLGDDTAEQASFPTSSGRGSEGATDGQPSAPMIREYEKGADLDQTEATGLRVSRELTPIRKRHGAALPKLDLF